MTDNQREVTSEVSMSQWTSDERAARSDFVAPIAPAQDHELASISRCPGLAWKFIAEYVAAKVPVPSTFGSP